MSIDLDIQEKLAELPAATKVTERSDGLWMDALELDSLPLANMIKSLEGRLITISAVPLKNGETELIYHFALGKNQLNIKLYTKANQVNSITPVLPAANWIEREIHDLFGVGFVGHPNMERLIRPVQLREGFFREG